jgi:ATP-dependent RNA helicase RhlE
MEEKLGTQVAVIHSNKTQNYRIRSIENFNAGKIRILVTTDVMARGLHIDQISHVINFDTPSFPENYMHRIGRTGRAEQEGSSILFYTDKEKDHKEAIEKLMDMEITEREFPEAVEISEILIPEEQPRTDESGTDTVQRDPSLGSGFHEKKEKNKKVNLGGSYKRTIAKKYKKPKTRGDKIYNKQKKRK